VIHRTRPEDTDRLPGGIPYIISNEAAERFSFYGMKAALAIFLANYLGALGGNNLSESTATAYVAWFNTAVYLTPLVGAIVADAFFGKYRTIVTLSIVYCFGHLCLAFMGVGGVVQLWLLGGLGLIAVGAGGIKPCVSAHVGDQFGSRNQHHLTTVFNIFYFSINFGAVVSNLLIPWILKWHGPHWAFGIPGVLMALATLFFWMGRRKFAHIPAEKGQFFKEFQSTEGFRAILRLLPLILFVGIFWCLFDQTASTFVFQAQRMDRNFFGFEALPSQIQAVNPFLILVLIPLFTFILYPFVEKRLKIVLTPLRKIGAGLFIMVGSFVVVAVAQEAIDRGETPHVAWQVLAYLILTAAEVLISIVGLEFFYTQAPRKMKSFMMALFLVSVSVGNTLTGLVNGFIQVPSPQFSEGTNLGFDKVAGTIDDLLEDDEGNIQSAATPALESGARTLEAAYLRAERMPLSPGELGRDPWGGDIRYEIRGSTEAILVSNGPDQKPNTEWDLSVKVKAVEPKEPESKPTWLERHTAKQDSPNINKEASADSTTFETSYQAGGGVRLSGASYFWFFTKLMAFTAILFVPFAMFYKPRTYLQDEDSTETAKMG